MIDVHGSCHCGRIAYEAAVDPAAVTICHCTACQQLSGTAYRVSVPTAVEDFRLLSGEPRIYVKTADSGALRAQAFCADCGSPLYAHAVEAPRTYGLRVGCLDQRRDLVPKRQIWCDSALAWTDDLTGIERAARDR